MNKYNQIIHDNMTNQDPLIHIYQSLLTLRTTRKTIESFLLFQIYKNALNPVQKPFQQTSQEQNNDMHLVSQYEKALQVILNKFRTQTELLQDAESNETRQLKWDLSMETKLNEELREKMMYLEKELDKCHSVIREAICIEEEVQDSQEDASV